MEVLSAYSTENTIRIERQEEILKILKKLDYDLYRIIEFKETGIKYIQKILFFDPKFDHNQANYLIIPSENKVALQALKEKYEFS